MSIDPKLVLRLQPENREAIERFKLQDEEHMIERLGIAWNFSSYQFCCTI